MALLFKDDEDFRKHNQKAEDSMAETLRDAVLQIERLEAEKQDVAREQKDVYTVLKSKGFDVKAVKLVVKERKRDANDLAEERAIVEQYKLALE